MKKIFIPVFLLLIFSCNNPEGQPQLKADLMEVIDEPSVAAAEMPPPPPSAVTSTDDVSDATNDESEVNKKSSLNISFNKKIVKNGAVRIQVGDIGKSQTKVKEAIQDNGAYIQKEEFDNSDMSESLALTIRVPHRNFDALVNSFSDGVGSVLFKNISSDDLTEEYTDVSIKLENKKIYLYKYRDMLLNAKTTKDMLEIQENIRELEDEIDVSEGRLKFIDDRVNFSTLELILFKEKVRTSTTSTVGFGSRFGDSFTQGWNSFVAFFLGLISFWPFFLLIPILIFGWRKWRNRIKK
jgi:hypothetical protein